MEKAHALTSFSIKNSDDDSGAIRCDPGEGLLLLLLVFPVLLLLPFFAAARPVRTVCATPGAAPSFWRPSHRPGAEGQHRDSSCARRWGNNEASGDLDCRLERHSAFRIQPSHEIFTGIKMQWVGLSDKNQFGMSLMQVSSNFLSSIGSPFRCRCWERKQLFAAKVCSTSRLLLRNGVATLEFGLFESHNSRIDETWIHRVETSYN